MKRLLRMCISFLLIVTCLCTCIFAASVSGSNSTYKMSASAAMSDVSGEAATQTSKLSGSTVYSFHADVTAYAKDGTYDYDSKTRYATGDIIATATAPGSSTPYRAYCRSYFYATSSSAAKHMINQYVYAG